MSATLAERSAATFPLSPEERAAFERDGFVRLPGAFAREAALTMQDEWWAELAETRGAHRDDPSTWPRKIGGDLRRAKVAESQRAFETPRMKGAIDALLGEDAWDWPRDWGRALVTFPCGRPASEWDVPAAIWHWDGRTDWNHARLLSLFVVAFVGEVRPASGGTLVLAGSPRLVRRLYGALSATQRAHGGTFLRDHFGRTDPWLRALTGNAPSPADRIQAFMRDGGEVEGVPVRVVELTGAPGDVIVCDPLLAHGAAPNCGDAPRMMRIKQQFMSREAQRLSKAEVAARS